MARALASSAGTRFDVPASHPASDVGPCIGRCLASKGFAVVATEVDEYLSKGVVADLQAAEKQRRLEFRQPPRLVAEGFLGESGAARLCELAAPEVQEQEGTSPSLWRADNALSDLGSMLEASVEEEMGVSLVGRTTAVVLETGEPGVMQPDLTDEVAHRWLGTFAKAKIMALVFIGPGEGTLELQAFDEEDAEPFSITTRPGMTVLLRADVLTREYQGAEAYVLTSFFLAASQAWFKDKPVDKLHPAALAIDIWICERLADVKRRIDAEAESALTPSLPREFQRIMNRQILKGERTAIRGTSCKLGTSHGIDQFHSTLLPCTDYAEEVPLARWDIHEHYDPDVNSFSWGKVCCSHMTVVPDIDLFDNKFFLISQAEASKMDVCERQFLEVGYEIVANAGVKKKELMGGDCGVYVAWQSEQTICEDRGMGANRFSFCLGCKGPSLSCDTDHASSLVAIKIASNELGRACSQGLAMGCSFSLASHYWLVHCGAHMMSPAGRCSSFDANAYGFIRGDTVAGVYVKPATKEVDGKTVFDEGRGGIEGVLTSAVCKNQGAASTLRALRGPCLQEVFIETVRSAKISPLDIDVVECDAKGDLMNDAVEVCSALRALRPGSNDDSTPVNLGSVKTNIGNSWPASGMVGVMKVLACGLYGALAPSVHLNQCNPQMDTEALEKPLNIVAESINRDDRSDCGFTAVTACGWGGTHGQLLFWNRVDPERMSLGKPAQMQKLLFWPGGGGFLEKDQEPKQNYCIVGTWSSWSDPQAMDDEGNGTYGFTVTLGENCWELFQIWLDGDETQVLHPGFAKAAKDFAVQGPHCVGVHYNWIIDGRQRWAQEVSASDEPGFIEVEHADRGGPGAQYRVRLIVAGKWRTVSWERFPDKLPSAIHRHSLARGGGNGSPHYFVTGCFNYWAFQEMTLGDAPGVYSAEVTLTRPYGADFQIARNEDRMQVVYPASSVSHVAEDQEILGPDDESQGRSWHIDGQVGDTFTIHFTRSTDVSGVDRMSVSWLLLGHLAMKASPTKYFVVGSWDGFRSRREMALSQDGDHTLEVSLGKEAEGMFQVLVDGNFSAVLHPSIDNADPRNEHWLLGPDVFSPFYWKIGKSEEDEGTRGRNYLIRLVMRKLGRSSGVRPASITWEAT